LIPDFSVKPADDVDLNLQISCEQSFTTNSLKPNKKMFQLPNLKDKPNNSQPLNDLSMETNRQKNTQPNSENEFQSEKEDTNDIWMQQDDRWKSTKNENDQDPVDFDMHQNSQTETDYSNDEDTIKSSNKQAVQINSPKINKPTYEKDKTTYPDSISMSFLSETDEEILPIPTIEEKRKPIAPSTTPPKRKRGRPRKDDSHKEQFPPSKSKVKEKKDQITLQRKVNDEKERWIITQDLMENENTNPIKLEKFKKENDLWNRDKLVMWKQGIQDNNADLDVPRTIFPV
jgi:hypothetical protein